MKKGFTLIELLVVITIIGILAAGATAVYSTAQEKSRDAVRITDITAVETASMQSYTDLNAYPADAAAVLALKTNGYIASLPTDPKTGNVGYDYWYLSAANAAGVIDQDFEISTKFENANNTTTKSATDGGEDDTRFEKGTKKSIVTSAAVGVIVKETPVAGS